MLLHVLQHDRTSILSIAADGRYIYSGSQARDIFVWDRTSLRIKATLRGHTGSVLALETCEEKKWLFSASGDSTLRIWSTETLAILYVIVPHLDTDSGDIYSLTYSPKLSTVYFGCQNTSIQWLDLSNISTPSGATALRAQETSSSTPGTPGKRFHKFFDSVPQSQRNSINPPHKRSSSQHSNAGSVNELNGVSPPELHVPPENVISSAHYGYIYCMALSPSHLYGGDNHPDEELYLLTGSGDEEVKVSSSTPLTCNLSLPIDVARNKRRINRKAYLLRLRRWRVIPHRTKRDHLRRLPRRPHQDIRPRHQDAFAHLARQNTTTRTSICHRFQTGRRAPEGQEH